MSMFRYLRADEVECRIQSVKQNGLVLLLYKDARCDMNILDETVGAMNWKREHCRDNHNCIVSIWDDKKGQWISKEDTGTESNTEAQKGLASDSFKRACFNWGIGRELYTSPFIWIPATKKNAKGGIEVVANIRQQGQRYVCYDKFICSNLGIFDGKIVGLVIKNKDTGKTVFKYMDKEKVEEMNKAKGVKRNG